MFHRIDEYGLLRQAGVRTDRAPTASPSQMVRGPGG
jgi:hypothetical protein